MECTVPDAAPIARAARACAISAQAGAKSEAALASSWAQISSRTNSYKWYSQRALFSLKSATSCCLSAMLACSVIACSSRSVGAKGRGSCLKPRRCVPSSGRSRQQRRDASPCGPALPCPTCHRKLRAGRSHGAQHAKSAQHGQTARHSRKSRQHALPHRQGCGASSSRHRLHRWRQTRGGSRPRRPGRPLQPTGAKAAWRAELVWARCACAGAQTRAEAARGGLPGLPCDRTNLLTQSSMAST